MRKLRFVAQIGASLFLRERFFRNRSQFVVCAVNRTRRAGFRLRCPSKPQGKGFDEPHEVNVGSEILSSHRLTEFRPLSRTGKRYARIRKAPTSPTAATPYCSLYPPQAALANVPPSPPRAGSSDRIRGAAVASIPPLVQGHPGGTSPKGKSRNAGGKRTNCNFMRRTRRHGEKTMRPGDRNYVNLLWFSRRKCGIAPFFSNKYCWKNLYKNPRSL